MKRLLAILTGAALTVVALLSWATPGGAVEFQKYAIESASLSLSSHQAGAHADLSIGFSLTEESGQPYAQTRDVRIQLPPGLVGNPQAVPRCTVEDLGNEAAESKCPLDSQVGITELKLGGLLNTTGFQPLYNMVPPDDGETIARFGFFAGDAPAFVNVRVDPSDYSVVSTIEGIASAAALIRAVTTVWAVPAAPAHDLDRLTPLEGENGQKPSTPRSAGVPEKPFLTNPTSCGSPRPLIITATSYQLPDAPSSREVPFPQMGGCDKLAFEPQFTAVATNPEAFAPSGFDTELTLPQDENPQGRATSTIRSAVVRLPEGFSINPAAGAGQQACSSAQVHFGEDAPADCPDPAKIGSVEVDVPALEKPLHGAVYLRTPEPGHLFRFWVVTDEQGVHLKLPAEIELNPASGQITTVFAGLSSLGGLPQVPFRSLRLQVFGGPRAPLATPGCGTYYTSYSLSPWSGNPAVSRLTPTQISNGCGKGGFSPELVAGTLNPGGGEYSPFTLTLTRSDGEANPSTIALHMPQGLLAKLGGVPLCSDAEALTGACPLSSRIGSVIAAAGVGGAPLWIPQPGKAPTAAYLAGPYKGAPYSVVTVVPAQAGPFDLGLVVNRARIEVDPVTALATITTDPLPQILEGVPVSYRTVSVLVDRPEFTINPTSCEEKEITATVTATDGQVAEPSDDFQATNCAKLAYGPKLTLTFTGQTKRTGNPGVRAVLTQKPGQANTKATIVLLPKSQFIDNSHISNPCTRVQFAADACPKGSILGTIEAKTPLLDAPLKGKLFFRSNGGERELPDIVADLRGPNGLRVIQVGFIDSVNGRVRTRFLSVPDVPLTRIELKFYAGKRSLIENSEDLCKTPRRGKVHLVGQNGTAKDTKPAFKARCH